MAQAQACLEYAHQLAPNEEYIIRHLQIVQTRITKLNVLPGVSKEKEIAFADFDPMEYGGNVLSLNKLIESTTTTVVKIPNPIELQQQHQSDNNNNKKNKKATSTTTTQTTTGSTTLKGSKRKYPTSSKLNDPTFIESETMSSKIDDDYRPSNSGRTGINRGRYHLHNNIPHKTSSSSGSSSSNNNNINHNNKGSQSIIGTDMDDPSSGMS